MSKARVAKARILKQALDLFNKQGTRTVTTNHIAKACDMSPGNLYYYFKNKEQIIAAIFEKMIADWDDEVVDMGGLALDRLLDEQLEKTFKYVWTYRFIHRELAALLDRDSRLKARCHEVLQQRLFEIVTLIIAFEQGGYIKKLEEEERGFIAKTALYYGLFWQPYLEVIGERPTKKNVLHGVNMIRLLLKPYRLKQ